MAQPDYIPVEITSLKEGMLADRPLLVFLPENKRYIRLVRPLHPVSDALLGKMNRFGAVFSTEPAIEERIPELADAARAVRELCDDPGIAPFERNRAIRTLTGWLAPLAFGTSDDTNSMAALFFFHRTFGAPRPETVKVVEDESVELYERNLRVAALAGLFALWLGYSETGLLTQYVETVFCKELLRTGVVPGLETPDRRFDSCIALHARWQYADDDLFSLAEFAKWIAGAAPGNFKDIAKYRAVRKLRRIFTLETSALWQRKEDVAA